MSNQKKILKDLASPFEENEKLTLVSLSKQVDDTDADIIEVFGDGEYFTPKEIEDKTRKLLAERKNQVMMTLDGKKLQEAMKIINGMEQISDVITDFEVIARVKESIKTPMDLKFLTDAYKTLSDKLQMLTRLDTVDSEGTARDTEFILEYKTKSGSSVKFAARER